MTETEMVDARVPPEELLYLPILTSVDGTTATPKLHVYRICATVVPVDGRALLKNAVIVAVAWEVWTWTPNEMIREKMHDDRIPLLIDRASENGFTDDLKDALLSLLSASTSGGYGVRRLQRPQRAKREDDEYVPTPSATA